MSERASWNSKTRLTVFKHVKARSSPNISSLESSEIKSSDDAVVGRGELESVVQVNTFVRVDLDDSTVGKNDFVAENLCAGPSLPERQKRHSAAKKKASDTDLLNSMSDKM